MATKTLVALYDRLSDAHEAVDDLVSAGIPRDSITLVANDATREYEGELTKSNGKTGHSDAAGSGAAFGGVLGGLAGLLVGLGAFAIPGVGPIVAAGPLVAVLTGAAAGGATGGIIGGLTDLGVSETEAHNYAEGVRRGGTLVSIKLDSAQSSKVTDILEEHDPVDIETRSAQWRDTGWQKFDPSAKPYGASEIAAERARYGYDEDEEDEDEDTLSSTGTGSTRPL
jgi:hypothetical protein